MDLNDDTIVAITTPAGRSGVGILRISGRNAQNVARLMLGKIPKPRYADCLRFKDTEGVVIDNGIALWFPAPNSFTGEDVLELHGHGNPVILDLLLKYILRIPGIRIANPGEFSERAFLNGKLDLTQAEAISDLINARSEQEARSALNSLQGVFSYYVNLLAKLLIDLRVRIEASLDFPDEEIDHLADDEIELRLNEIIDYLNSIRIKANDGCLLREGIKVVIIGRPNTGKSSLLNSLIGEEFAIVTNIAGTTRDVLHQCVYIDGIPFHITDTAGLRDARDEIERIGISRTCQEIEKSDLILFVVDSTSTVSVNPEEICPDFINRLPKTIPITIVRNKVDITGEKLGISNINGYTLIRLSARTGDGVNILRNHLRKCSGINVDLKNSFLARRRHLQALEEVLIHLNYGKTNLLTNKTCSSNECLAEDLRLAQRSLGKITGEYASDDLLNEIFSNFCIGK